MSYGRHRRPRDRRALGTAVGTLVLYLRRAHREAVGLDDFLALGLIALTYGIALACHAYGFLAVFAAGLALRRVERKGSKEAGQSVVPMLPPDAAGAETWRPTRRRLRPTWRRRC